MDSPQVSPEVLSLVLYEISIRVPDQVLQALSSTTLWPSIVLASQDQNWWFRRTEYLVGRTLTPREGNWSSVYASLATDGLEFLPSPEDQVSNPLLVRVLLEIGADPTVDDSTVLIVACAMGITEVVQILLEDGRADPGAEGGEPIFYSSEEGHTDVVRILLADGRADPSSMENRALHAAAKFGFADVVELLIADSRVVKKEVRQEDNSPENYSLYFAVMASHVEATRLLLTISKHPEWLFLDACKGSSVETIQLLIDDKRIDVGYYRDALNLARRRKRRDLEELLVKSMALRIQ